MNNAQKLVRAVEKKYNRKGRKKPVYIGELIYDEGMKLDEAKKSKAKVKPYPTMSLVFARSEILSRELSCNFDHKRGQPLWQFEEREDFNPKEFFDQLFKMVAVE